jgi:hypothetical protein
MSFHWRKFLVDESPYIMYQDEEENERINQMFNPYLIGQRDFTVTFLKQDGTTKTMTGNMFGPDKGAAQTEDAIMAHLVAMDEGVQVKMFTDAGWRSFLKGNLLAIVIH